VRFGPTSIKLNSVIASTLRRPKLRTGLRISKQVMGGEESVVINVPGTAIYCRLGSLEFSVLELCDGTRTPAEIAAELRRRDPESELEESEVADFLDSVDRELWEKSLGEKNLAILEKIKEERNERVDRASILYMYFKAWDPDSALERMHPYLKWLFTPGFVIFSVFLFFLTFVIVVADWPRISRDTIEFYNFTNKTAYDIWVFWILLFFISGIHEFGHGLTCKHFGGQVHQMGLMLVFFTPAFYTDCTDMHMFDRTSKRLWTIFNGLWVEMVMCGLATLVWYFSPPGSFTSDIAYKTLLLTGVSGLFFNLNPLMKFDGYYALSQYLGIDNMREDSFNYLKLWIQRTIFRRDVEVPAVGKRRKRIFLTFGTAAFLYSTFVLVAFSLFIRNVFTKNFGDWGYPLTFVAVYMLLRKRIRKAWPVLRNATREAKEFVMARRFSRKQQAAFAGIVLLITVPPLATEVATDFTLEPGTRSEVRAVVPGVISDLRVQEGGFVKAGAILATLENADLDARLRLTEKDAELSERELLLARSRGDLAAAARHSELLSRARAALADARAKHDLLVLRAPFDGIVTTPQIEDLAGTFLVGGATFATVVDRSVVRARILVRDWEFEDVQVGARAKLKVRAFPLKTFEGTVEKIMPAAAADRPVADPLKHERYGQETTNFIAVVLNFPNPDGALQEGMTGTAKIYGKRYPLAVKAGRSAWRWFRSQVWW
jgi:putative peptide zinc metalloprotease protein